MARGVNGVRWGCGKGERVNSLVVVVVVVMEEGEGGWRVRYYKISVGAPSLCSVSAVGVSQGGKWGVR